MTPEENKILKICWNLAHEIENQFPNKLLLEQILPELLLNLRKLSQSANLQLQKLSLIADHLHPQMELRHFLNYIIPIERNLGRNLRDDQFLVTSVDRAASQINPRAPLIFVLENLRSAFNVGSIFRLADCLSASEVHLIGYTMTPSATRPTDLKMNSNSASDPLLKTSLGASETVPWKNWPHLGPSLENLRGRGFEIIALETAEKSKNLFECQFQNPTAFVVGNERYGLEPSALKLCDQVVQVPTWGLKNSLNVSQALSIGAYEWKRQWK